MNLRDKLQNLNTAFHENVSLHNEGVVKEYLTRLPTYLEDTAASGKEEFRVCVTSSIFITMDSPLIKLRSDINWSSIHKIFNNFAMENSLSLKTIPYMEYHAYVFDWKRK